jgi:hypothetical protein
VCPSVRLDQVGRKQPDGREDEDDELGRLEKAFVSATPWMFGSSLRCTEPDTEPGVLVVVIWWLLTGAVEVCRSMNRMLFS